MLRQIVLPLHLGLLPALSWSVVSSMMVICPQNCNDPKEKLWILKELAMNSSTRYVPVLKGRDEQYGALQTLSELGRHVLTPVLCCHPFRGTLRLICRRGALTHT